MVVDDEREIRESLADILRDEGYDVLEARNGRDALDVLQRARGAALPCVIILDLMMPVMDGQQFRAEQLRDAELAGIPVVVVSADSNVQGKAASMKVAAALPKPLQLDAFVGEIDRHCRVA
jgi:CheY-like chemotaxis protein